MHLKRVQDYLLLHGSTAGYPDCARVAIRRHRLKIRLKDT